MRKFRLSLIWTNFISTPDNYRMKQTQKMRTEDAIFVLEAMAGLGAEVPLPRGATLWLARIPEREYKGFNSTKPLGVYVSEEDALEALGIHAEKVWKTSYYTPYGCPWWIDYHASSAEKNKTMEEWIKNHSSREVCELYVKILSEHQDCTFPNDVSFFIIKLKTQSA